MSTLNDNWPLGACKKIDTLGTAIHETTKHLGDLEKFFNEAIAKLDQETMAQEIKKLKEKASLCKNWSEHLLRVIV